MWPSGSLPGVAVAVLDGGGQLRKRCRWDVRFRDVDRSTAGFWLRFAITPAREKQGACEHGVLKVCFSSAVGGLKAEKPQSARRRGADLKLG